MHAEVRILHEELEVYREEQPPQGQMERARLIATLDTMADAVVLVDTSGAPVLSNQAYRRFVEQIATVQDEFGTPLGEDAYPAARAARGEAFTARMCVVDEDGSRRWYEAVGCPVESDRADPVVPAGGVVVIRDITDQRVGPLQEELMAVVGHELRAPLSAIQGYLDILERISDDHERSADFRARARRQVAKMADLISELQDLGRVAGGLTLDRAPVEIGLLVAETVGIARSLTSQRVDFDPPRERIVVDGDEGRLEQVVLNLLTNAIDHAPESPRIEVRLTVDDARVRLAVEDFGPGIPREELASLFDRYYRVMRQQRSGASRAGLGLGLGLYIARRIVEAHGGRIEAISEVGSGTTVTVELPVLERVAGDA